MTQAILVAHSYSTKAIEALLDLFKSFKQRRIKKQEYKHTYKELNRLSDKDLRDIGLCRGDIHSIANGTSDLYPHRMSNYNENLKGWV